MLLQDCQGGGVPQEAQDLAGLSQWGTCVGYIAAVLDTMSNASLTASSSSLCYFFSAVQLWLRNHPEKRDLAASFLVFQALKEKFPCN